MTKDFTKMFAMIDEKTKDVADGKIDQNVDQKIDIKADDDGTPNDTNINVRQSVKDGKVKYYKMAIDNENMYKIKALATYNNKTILNVMIDIFTAYFDGQCIDSETLSNVNEIVEFFKSIDNKRK